MEKLTELSMKGLGNTELSDDLTTGQLIQSNTYSLPGWNYTGLH
jgi:hypothetical protein